MAHPREHTDTRVHTHATAKINVFFFPFLLSYVYMYTNNYIFLSSFEPCRSLCFYQIYVVNYLINVQANDLFTDSRVSRNTARQALWCCCCCWIMMMIRWAILLGSDRSLQQCLTHYCYSCYLLSPFFFNKGSDGLKIS